MQSGPVDLRSTFEMFKFYRPEIGIHQLLVNAGVSRMSPRQIYQAVHNRSPDSLVSGSTSANFVASDTFLAAISSTEFQEHLAAHLLSAFPEKRRLFFVHIPKTAGVDLATHIASRCPSLSTNLLDRNITRSPEQIFLAIKHLVLEMQLSDTIFISGHTHLNTYQKLTGNGIRFHDRVFTVVRNPMQQLLSQLNYTLTRIFADEDPVQPDTQGWRAEFGAEDVSKHGSHEAIVKLARAVLRHKGVVVPNIICSFLGGGNYEASIVGTLANDLEVIELASLDDWTAEHWQVTERTRLNSSKKFLSLEDLSADDMNYARSIVDHDLKYHSKVTEALNKYGGTSIRGEQILG